MYSFSNERLDKLDQQTQLLKGDTTLYVAIVAHDTNFKRIGLWNEIIDYSLISYIHNADEAFSFPFTPVFSKLKPLRGYWKNDF